MLPENRQKKRWEDNIREWTGLEFGRFQRAVDNREKWRKLVGKSPVVPKRPSRLRDHLITGVDLRFLCVSPLGQNSTTQWSDRKPVVTEVMGGEAYESERNPPICGHYFARRT